MLPLEELDFPLVLFRCLACPERTQVASPAGFRVYLSGVEAVFAGFEFPDHGMLLIDACCLVMVPGLCAYPV